MTPKIAKTATFGLSTIGQIFVRARDLERAVPFYRDTLGMPFLFQVPKMAFFQCGSTTLMLGVPDAPEFDHPGSILYYLVPDIEAAHETLQKRGVAFLTTPHLVHRASDHELWMTFFRDPDGNTLALMSRKPPR
jgi:predicted enzyme related to lactoylglutathione lyase